MKDGLSNPSVLAIYQDTLGRMWFGTNEGVNIYDGKQIYKCKSYLVGQSQQVKLINGSINQIVGDSLGIFICVIIMHYLGMTYVKKNSKKYVLPE